MCRVGDRYFVSGRCRVGGPVLRQRRVRVGDRYCVSGRCRVDVLYASSVSRQVPLDCSGGSVSAAPSA